MVVTPAVHCRQVMNAIKGVYTHVSTAPMPEQAIESAGYFTLLFHQAALTKPRRVEQCFQLFAAELGFFQSHL